jgi:hypothetical protein
MTIFNILATSTTAIPSEPIVPWNLFLTAILIPTGLFILFQYIKKEMAKNAKIELDKEQIIQRLVREREEYKDREDNFAHELINTKLEQLHTDFLGECKYSKETREEIFDKLSTIDVTLKLINGSVRDTQKELAVHKAESNHG